MQWHTLDTDELLNETGSSINGLSSKEVNHRIEKFGKNRLEEKKKKPAWLLFLHQFTDFMILALVAAAVIAGIAGDRTDMIIILVIILLNAIIGFVQEYRAGKAMEALKRMATPFSTVIRNGNPHTISSEELVPGDLVMMEAGNTIPADLRLLEAHSLRIEESSLTGESVPVDKNPNALQEADLALGDLSNMAFKGTQVVNGRGKGIAVKTGMQTELGKIAGMLQSSESITPLQKRMTDFGKKLSYLIILICIILFLVGWLRGEEPLHMLLLSISLAVAAIPEALPALITIALARGANRLVQQELLIRKLPAVETLGSVTYICTDKTGTLTKNKMTVQEVHEFSSLKLPDQSFTFLQVSMLLNHDVKDDGEGGWIGDPTEIAMVSHYDKKDGEKMEKDFPRVGELPFDSDRKCMSTIHRYGNDYLFITKGAVESISAILKKQDQGLQQKAEAMASEGMRVIAYSYKILNTLPSGLNIEEVEKGMEASGLVGLIDPPREEIIGAIRECHTAGIKPVMITGDHKETATAIAKQIGIMDEGALVLTGSELTAMEEGEFLQKVERIRVYARVSPAQKLQIIKGLQQKDHFVAMTGDGVNDAPSLKAANIGIAMGITGTDVSKEAAHMILLDDNFSTIVKAVKEGRRIYDNIRRFVKYIMTCNSAEIWTIFLAPLLGLPIPLLPIHILWINLVTDGLPGLALSTEKAEPNVMNRPPRKPGESLFAEGTGVHIIWVGLLMAAITLGVQAFAIGNNNPHWQTMVFTVLSLSQLGHVMAIRSDFEFIYTKGFFTNKPLVASVFFTIVLQLAIVYLPFANDIFKTQPLSAVELGLCFSGAILLFHAVEAEKFIKRKKGNTP